MVLLDHSSGTKLLAIYGSREEILHEPEAARAFAAVGICNA